MDGCATSVAIISSMAAIWTGEVRAGNEEAIAAAQQFPGRLYVHAVANPHRPEDAGQLAELLQRDEVRGIKVHPHTHSCRLDDPAYDWIWDLAVEHDMPVLGHSFAGTWHSDPEQFGTVAGRFPQLVLVAGHAGATPAGFRTMATLATRCPNLHAEICGSAMTGWWLRHIVTAFGPDRVLYGTDANLIDARYGLGRVLYAPLNDGERNAILAGNARRLYRLPPLNPPRPS
jgi:predicted TIM-barrel fold metal-dependent hydrolase